MKKDVRELYVKEHPIEKKTITKSEIPIREVTEE